MNPDERRPEPDATARSQSSPNRQDWRVLLVLVLMALAAAALLVLLSVWAR